jgi:hypothetical protein
VRQLLRALYNGPISGLHRWPKECYAIYAGRVGQPLRRLPQPLLSYRADPFLVRHEQRNWLFYEEFEYLRNKGRLAVCEVDEDARWLGRPATILDCPYHLSYPHVFFHEDTWWMVPESCENGTVDLYRCQRFPNVWSKELTLLHVDACDTTLHLQQGCWWLFTAVRNPRDGERHLEIYTSPRLASPEWQPHPVNGRLLYADAPNGSQRPAGPLLRVGERWLRPSQHSPDYYGQGCRFYEIQRLTPEEFVETPASLPDLPTARNHHICLQGDLCVIDVKERISYWPWVRPRPASS